MSSLFYKLRLYFCHVGRGTIAISKNQTVIVHPDILCVKKTPDFACEIFKNLHDTIKSEKAREDMRKALWPLPINRDAQSPVRKRTRMDPPPTISSVVRVPDELGAMAQQILHNIWQPTPTPIQLSGVMGSGFGSAFWRDFGSPPNLDDIS
jgi:hypothetical protein